MTLYQVTYGLSILATALVAGLFYGFQCSVIKGLGALNDEQYLMGFQSINRKIQNPIFFFTFLGCLVLLPLCTYLSFKIGNNQQLPYAITATLIYIIGVFGITIFCNVPLNEKLDLFTIGSATGGDLQIMRVAFELKWNRWHLVRTIFSIVTLLTLIMPLVRRI